MIAHVLPAVLAERCVQPAILLDRLEHADEFFGAAIAQPAVAAHTLSSQRFRRAVRQHGLAQTPRFDGGSRKALVARRHDHHFRGGYRIELLRVVQRADADELRMFGHGEWAFSDEDQRKP
jgi:hypothetical protein